MLKSQKIILHRLGHSFRDCTRIVEEYVRAPDAGEVVIEMHFAGVNGVYDQMLCANEIQHRPVTPPTDTGVEAIGVVTEVGSNVKTLQTGDAVVTIGAAGGYRQFAVCAEGEAIRVPAVSREILALIPSGVSAMIALERVGEMTSDETIVISAAAGGLGNIAVQLAVNAGNRVIGICGDDRKAVPLLEFGVQRVLQYKRDSIADVLREDYGNEINLAMDSVGGEMFEALLDNMAPRGRLVSCGATVDRLPPERVLQQRMYTRLYWQAISVRGFNNFLFSEYAPEARKRLLAMLAEGTIVPLLDQSEFCGLSSVSTAGEYLLSGANTGKVIVDLRQKVDLQTVGTVS